MNWKQDFDDLDQIMHFIERFVVLMYGRSSNKEHVNDSRIELFAQKGRAFDSILPTKAALVEHIKRAIFQGGCVWGKELLTLSPQLPSPANLGWTRGSGNQWEPVCQELIWFVLSKANPMWMQETMQRGM